MLKGLVALVDQAGNPVGQAIAERLSSEGANVVVSGENFETIPLHYDVIFGSPSNVMDRLYPGKLDILVNNGRIINVDTRLPPEQVDENADIAAGNIARALEMSEEILPLMAPGSNIVHVTTLQYPSFHWLGTDLYSRQVYEKTLEMSEKYAPKGIIVTSVQLLLAYPPENRHSLSHPRTTEKERELSPIEHVSKRAADAVMFYASQRSKLRRSALIEHQITVDCRGRLL